MSRGARAVLALLLGGLAGGCELEQVTVTETEPRAVVHAVLNGDATQQVVLVEEMLTGRVAPDSQRAFTPLDPIASAGGVPISEATVHVGRVGGDSVLAAEDGHQGRGTGVYRLSSTTTEGSFSSTLSLVPGARYFIRVRTTDGRMVSGETTLPGRPAGVDPGEGSTATASRFNRTTDTVRLRWTGAPAARTYAIRLETPFGPFAFFNDETRFDIAGSLRNILATGLPSAFWPGFAQRLTLAAVDTNFYDYYRSNNDPFSGTGLINRLEGGVGLFGALMPIEARTLLVRADPRTPPEPAEGTFTGSTGVGPISITAALRVWLEGGSGEFRRLSGNLTASGLSGSGPTTYPHIGTVNGDRVRIAVLRSQSAIDTGWVIAGTLRGDTLDATLAAHRSAGMSFPITFRRTGPPPTWPPSEGVRAPDAASGDGRALRHALEARRIGQRRAARASAEAPRWHSPQTP